ncbi:histidine kinase [Leptolyngbya sp. AN02str]|uniref:histidine kinase n=1 Tax=Leptolyngbya sp. AN02str TaxID=3423363 RepID=UPI003D316184
MADSMRDKISSELQKAKAEGSLRADRIKAIVREAIALALGELKEGSGEVGGIARDAVSVVVAEMKDKGQDTAENLRGAVEGAVEGISAKRKASIAQTQQQIDTLQAQIVDEQAQLESEVNGALVKIETTSDEVPSDVKRLLEQTIATVRDSEAFDVMLQQYARLKAKLAVLDANLAARYGDRYDDVKAHLENAKAWYERTRTQLESGEPHPVQTKYVEVDRKIGELGTAIAKKEKHVKELLKDLWNTVTHI